MGCQIWSLVNRAELASLGSKQSLATIRFNKLRKTMQPLREIQILRKARARVRKPYDQSICDFLAANSLRVIKMPDPTTKVIPIKVVLLGRTAHIAKSITAAKTR